MEDVALATDLDKDTSDEDRVALMTIHLAKGLEFPYVFVVGMEEDLFPSAMSLNTRSDLEEERRLFYVALTRAEHQAYLTYAQSRYRWGKLTDSEPSRFIEEINEDFIEYINPVDNGGYRYKPTIDLTSLEISINRSCDWQNQWLEHLRKNMETNRFSSSTIRKLKPVWQRTKQRNQFI